MKIGFDAKRAFSNTSGLGNYARTLIGSLNRYYPENEYLAFTPSAHGPSPWPHTRVMLPSALPARLFPSLWRSLWMSRDIEHEQLHIFHGLSNELPRGIRPPTRKVVTIHDLIFLRFPQWYPAADRKIYEVKFRQACNDADAIVAVSRQTRDDIVDLFGTTPEKISVVYQSCEENFSRNPSPEELVTYRNRHLPASYLLSVGTVEERKNLMLTVRALRLLPGISLVVVGRKKKYYEEVQRYISGNGLEGRVLFAEGVTASELPFLYHGALALVYPSRYEGFGIPVIEALRSGTPVIAANTSALPEAGGPSSLYVDPDDEAALAAGVKQLAEDAGLRSRMVAEGLAYAKRFEAQQTSSELMNLYRELV